MSGMTLGQQNQVVAVFITNLFCQEYCRTANFHVLVILTNLTNEKNSLK